MDRSSAVGSLAVPLKVKLRTAAPSGRGTTNSASIRTGHGFRRSISMVVVAVCSAMTAPTVTWAISMPWLPRSATNERAWGTMMCAGMALVAGTAWTWTWTSAVWAAAIPAAIAIAANEAGDLHKERVMASS